MSDKDLMIFERRFQEWSGTHPGRWIATTDRKTAADFISSQTNKIRSAQLEAADRIIVSQDRIASGIDEIAVGIDRIFDGLEGLASAFEWGFSEMVWQLEQQRTVLEKILDVLQAPLDTQAKELRNRAENAYRNGWIDDALEDFLESERKNRYDFAIHQSLGNIYLFHKKSPGQALEYYEKAVKYATPKSPYHASLALLQIGLIKYLQEDFRKAYEAALKAIEFSPDLYEAHYQCAQYCANLGKYDEAVDHLEKAIEGDRYYCLKPDSEKDFNVMKEQLRTFFEDWRNASQDQAKKEIDRVQELIRDAASYGLSIYSDPNKLKGVEKAENEAKEFLKRGSLLDSWDSIDKALEAQELALDALKSPLSTQRLKLEKDQLEKEYHAKYVELRKKTKFWALFPSLIFTLIIIGGIAILIGAMIHISVGVCGGMALLLMGGSPLFIWLRESFDDSVFHILIKRPRTDYRSKLTTFRRNLLKSQIKRELLTTEEDAEDVDIECVRSLVAVVQEDAEQHGEKHKYSKEKLCQLYKNLPKDLQKATYSKEVACNIQEICTENGVTDGDVIFDVTKNIGYVFLGLLPPNEFSDVLEKELRLKKKTAEQIAREINDCVFLSIKASLEALYKRKITPSMPS